MVAYSTVKRIFYCGIGGSGMSALAVFDKLRGHDVSGSDRAFDLDALHPALSPLKASGIAIVPQDGQGVQQHPDLMVISTAVEHDRPEVVFAQKLGIPLRTRPQYLAEIISQYDTVAVSGTSGKSTAAGMLAYAMRQLDMEPNFLGGGRVKQFRSPTNPGNCLVGSSSVLVAEACESDGSLVDFHPSRSIILNLSLDHRDVADTARLFETLAAHTAKCTFVNADDRNLTSLKFANTLRFSLDNDSDLVAERLVLGPKASEFTVQGVRLHLGLPGKHNVYNALSAIAVLLDMGIALTQIASALAGFQGLERRFDIVLDDGNNLVIDDYAHNPHKVSALLKTVSRLRPGVCYVFQPHGYGPTKLMLQGYIEAFTRGLRSEDRLLVLPIYYAGGTTSRGVSSEDLAAGVRDRGANAEAVSSRDDVLKLLNKCSCWVVFGARDETLAVLAREIARGLSSR